MKEVRVRRTTRSTRTTSLTTSGPGPRNPGTGPCTMNSWSRIKLIFQKKFGQA